MASISAILNNWKNASEEDISLVKTKVYELIPEWKGQKICAVRCIDENQYVFGVEYSNEDKCVVYDGNNFILHNKHMHEFIPNAIDVQATFKNKTIFDGETTIIFVLFTGIYTVVICNSNMSRRYYFENKDSFQSVINYCQQNMEQIDNKFGDKATEYEFDSSKDCDRTDQWYAGDWVEMMQNGILGDTEHEQPFHNYVICGEGKYKIRTSNEIINKIIHAKYGDHEFTCDNCKKINGTFEKFYHCLECIKKHICFELCYSCMLKSVSHEHQLFDVTNTELIVAFTEHYKTE